VTPSVAKSRRPTFELEMRVAAERGVVLAADCAKIEKAMSNARCDIAGA
jgi:hypothetical protein